MNFKNLAFISIAFISTVVAKPNQQLPKDGVGPWIVNAYYTDIKQLRQYTKNNTPWQVNRKEKSFLVSVENLHQYQQLFSYGFNVEINLKQMSYKKENDLRVAKDKALNKDSKSIPGFSCERTVEETFATIDSLVASYPNLASPIHLGESWEKVNAGGQSNGYDLRVIKITNSSISGPKPKLFITSSMHARELAPAELNTRFAEYLLNGYGVDADATWIVDHREVHLMLQANPDGRKRAESADTNKRKNQNNFHNAGSNTRGVDMNRNFVWMWNQGSGSSGVASNQTYRGPSAQSEYENQAIDTHLKSLFVDARGNNLADAAPATTTGVYIDIHSEASLILWPYGFDSPNAIPEAPNHDQLQTLGRKFGWYNNYYPEKSNELYGADGASDDNAYGQLGVAAYTFELGGDSQIFRPTCGYVDNTIVPDNIKALVYAAKVAKTPYITASGPDIENIVFSSDSVSAGVFINITGVANDQHFNNANTSGAHPAESIQNITSVEMFVDELPWDLSSTAINLTASDGGYNNTVENFTGSIDTSGMSIGQHAVYLQTTDATGIAGVVYSKFFTIVDPATLGTLNGIVRDAVTNQPLESVNLVLGANQLQSDVQGQYDIAILAGNYTLSANKQGYASSNVTNISITAQQITVQDILLQPIYALVDESVENYNTIADAELAGWGQDTSVGNSDWTINPTGGIGGSHSFSTIDEAQVSDKSLMTQELNLTVDSKLEFWHTYLFEGGASLYDGGVIEITTDNGSTWQDLLVATNLTNLYDGTIDSGFNNPLAGRMGWGGSQSYEKIEVNLAVFAGTTAKIRWRFASDSSTGAGTWEIDDIKILDPNVGPSPIIFANGFEN